MPLELPPGEYVGLSVVGDRAYAVSIDRGTYRSQLVTVSLAGGAPAVVAVDAWTGMASGVAATEDGVMPALGDGIEQWHGLQWVPRAVGALAEPTVFDVVLHSSDLEGGAVELDGLVAELQDLRKVVAGVHMQHSERDRTRPKCLRR